MTAAAKARPGRLAALDQVRGFVVVLVVLHHSILAYCMFGHVDRERYWLSTAPIVDAVRWAGFDVAVRLNDGFFMPLLFLLSGLFVCGGVGRLGPWAYLRGRGLRLGVPFVVAELTVVPVAYYPSFLQAGGVPGFGAFWIRTVTAGPWPSGPPWFIAVLLGFDAVAVLVLASASGRVRLPERVVAMAPGQWFAVVVAGSAVLYLPLLALVGPSRWIGLGPLAVQESRVLLYAGYFGAGTVLGAGGLANVGRFCDTLARGWAGRTLLALLGAAGFALLGRVGGPGVTGPMLAVYCAAACFGVLAAFARFGGRPGWVWSSLVANSFLIFLLHYPLVTWVQFLLLPVAADGIAKGAATFVVALAASWGLAAMLRRVPGAARLV